MIYVGFSGRLKNLAATHKLEKPFCSCKRELSSFGMGKHKLSSNPVQGRLLRLLSPISTGSILIPKLYWKGDFFLSQRISWRYIGFLYSHWHLVPLNHVFKKCNFFSNCMGNCERPKVRKIHQDECLGLNMKPLTSALVFKIEIQIISGKKKCQ